MLSAVLRDISKLGTMSEPPALFATVVVRHLLRDAASYDPWRTNARPPRIGDIGAVVEVLAQSARSPRFIVECIAEDGSTSWLSEFDSPELEVVPSSGAEATIEENFISFLCQLSQGACPSGQWERFAVAHYASPKLESARAQLVRASLLSGAASWSSVPEAVRNTASLLHAQLAGTHGA